MGESMGCGSFGFVPYNGSSQSTFLNSCNPCLNKRCLNQSVEALQNSIKQGHFKSVSRFLVWVSTLHAFFKQTRCCPRTLHPWLISWQERNIFWNFHSSFQNCWPPHPSTDIYFPKSSESDFKMHLQANSWQFPGRDLLTALWKYFSIQV